MDKIKIGYDFEAEQVDNRNRPIKADHYQALKDYFNSFELVAPGLDINFKDTFITDFENKHRNSFPKFVTTQKMLELSSVDLNDLIELERKYYSIPTVIDNKDYSIFADTERQIRAWELSNRIIDLLSDFEGFYGKMSQKQYNDTAIIFKGLISSDRRTGNRSINVDRVKNI